MTSQDILNKFLDFYKDRGHKQVPNVSLVPEGDSTLLFVNSGMFPLVPYLSGQSHPMGKRITNVQRSLRFEDIEEVGDPRHTTAFHMIGNWSLGDYFKKEQLPWVYEFLIDVVGLDPKKMFATVFAGDEFAPKDAESIELIKSIFKKYGIDAKENERIFPCGRKDNWWKRGDAVGELGGPDSEVFYYIGNGTTDGKSPADYDNEFLEIGNSVFMQYKKTETGWEPLAQKNVDFGGGLERIAMVSQGKQDIFETDNFWPIILKIQELTNKDYYESDVIKKAMRTLADHMRSATFLAMDGVTPSNKEQGYILRRILRRMVRIARVLGIQKDISVALVGTACENLSWLYLQLLEKRFEIEKMFSVEEDKFGKTLDRGAKEVEKLLNKSLSSDIKVIAKTAFDLYQSIGYPAEIFRQDLKDRGINFDAHEFEKVYEEVSGEHQALSRSGAEQKFKGGLADHSDAVVKYHTATHLLQMALKKVVGTHVRQLGSNITGERLRFDFPNPQKLTDAQLVEVENEMNSIISRKLPVNFEIMPKEKAISLGAVYIPTETYPDPVKVYYIGETLDTAVSKEFCGGPHVSNTGEIGKLEIFKQENIGDGKLRVYVRFSN